MAYFHTVMHEEQFWASTSNEVLCWVHKVERQITCGKHGEVPKVRAIFRTVATPQTPKAALIMSIKTNTRTKYDEWRKKCPLKDQLQEGIRNPKLHGWKHHLSTWCYHIKGILPCLSTHREVDILRSMSTRNHPVWQLSPQYSIIRSIM